MAGYIDFSIGKSANFSANVEYKDVIKTLFAGFEISLLKRRETKILGQDFEGDYILNYYYPENWTTEMIFISSSLSKGVELINGTIAVYPLYIHNKSSILRNNIIIPYSSDSYSLRGMINARAGSKCNLTFQISYTYNQNQMGVNRLYFSSARLSESLKATYFPIKSLQISYTFDHYYNELTSGKFKNFILSDFEI